MRQSWTDERLDDLNGKVDRGFERIDADLHAQRAEFADHRSETKAEFTALRSEMKDGFDAMYRLMIQLGGAMLAALIGLVATQL